MGVPVKLILLFPDYSPSPPSHPVITFLSLIISSFSKLELVDNFSHFSD